MHLDHTVTVDNIWRESHLYRDTHNTQLNSLPDSKNTRRTLLLRPRYIFFIVGCSAHRPSVRRVTFTNFIAGPLANMRPNSATLTATIINHLDKIHSAHFQTSVFSAQLHHDRSRYLDYFQLPQTTCEGCLKDPPIAQNWSPAKYCYQINNNLDSSVLFSSLYRDNVSRPIFSANPSPHANDLSFEFLFKHLGICSRTVC